LWSRRFLGGVGSSWWNPPNSRSVLRFPLSATCYKIDDSQFHSCYLKASDILPRTPQPCRPVARTTAKRKHRFCHELDELNQHRKRHLVDSVLFMDKKKRKASAGGWQRVKIRRMKKKYLRLEIRLRPNSVVERQKWQQTARDSPLGIWTDDQLFFGKVTFVASNQLLPKSATGYFRSVQVKRRRL